MPNLCDLKRLSEQSCLSERTLRNHIKNGLPYFRVGGKILVDWQEFKEWLEQYRVTRYSRESSKVDKYVEAMLEGEK